MLVLGIVGGVASGKSLVSAAFAQLGAVVIDADKLGHEVLTEPLVIASARERWGDEVVASDGQLDRRAIAQRVFGDSSAATQERQFLEQLTHPHISARMRDSLSELATRGDVDAVVLDAALLLEAGWNEYCDHVLFVDVPREVRQQRARTRGWSDEQFAAREAAQLPVSEKRAAADIVIDNSGLPEHTAHQVAAAWHSLTAGSSSP